MKRYRSASDIRVCIVGYGGSYSMGKHHVDMANASGMTVTTIAETDANRRAVAAKEFPGLDIFPSVRKMIKSDCADLIVLVTPHNTHAKLALECLNAGKHVICEKPMAITTEECDTMIAAARKNRVMLSVYHNRHWDGCIVDAVKAVRSGAIGTVFRIEAHGGGRHLPGDSWRHSKSISGGIAYDWGVHYLEYALQILDGDIDEVSGFAVKGFWAPKCRWKKDTNEDEVFGTVRFRNGKWLTLCLSSLDSNPKPYWLEITGTEGTYLMGGNDWKMVRNGQYGTKVTEEGRNSNNAYEKYYRNIADHLTRGKRLIITAEWARRPIHVLDLMNTSSKKKRALKAVHR